MFVSTTAPALLALAARALALPSAGRRDVPSTSVWESVDAAPSAWAQAAIETEADESIELHIQLAQQNMVEFEQLALAIATPGNAKYGQHMTRDEIDAIIAPKEESRQLVMEWLGNNSLSDAASLNERGNIVIVETTVSKAEQLLNTKYNSYTNSETGESATRALSVSLPEILFEHISTIQPTTFFGFKPLTPKVRTDIGPEVTYTTPTTLSTLYNFKAATALTEGKMGIAGFIKQWPSAADLKTFLGKFAITGFGNSALSYTCTSVNSGQCPASPAGANIGVEANLDVQSTSTSPSTCWP
ncbi:hypothetical protein G7054_g14244 [Neopestalotiopsis clavispora]|nr:hypothetical protein G7054_g14244 [Neopestalotiopsis clavispora]